MTTKQDLSVWFDTGVTLKAEYLIVVCDSFDYETVIRKYYMDYPVYIQPGGNFNKRYAEYNGKNMQRVMEVYDLKADKTEQLDEHRTHRFPTTKP